MKEDIDFPEVKGVSIAITKETKDESDFWTVHLLNDNKHTLENVLVNSVGYGKNKDGKEQKTSQLRHMFEEVAPQTAPVVEPLDPNLIHLTNQYWVSYYIGTKIFDKRFIFVPETIIEENMTFIPLLEKEGILHD